MAKTPRNNPITKQLSKYFPYLLGFTLLIYITWWGYSVYKFTLYKPSVKKQQELITEFRQKLQQDGINIDKIKDVLIKYNAKEDDFSYLLKVNDEPYTYECYFSYCQDCKQEERKLYCQIQEVATGQITIVPTLAEDKARDLKDQKEYQQQFNKQYQELIKGLLLEKYLKEDLE